MKYNKISIVGLGLIGGSLAKAISSSLQVEKIVAFDKDPENIKLALIGRTIDEGYVDINDSIKGSQIIFICTPIKKVSGIIYEITSLIKHKCIITDVGSTKQFVLKQSGDAIRPPISFIGGHPMAGTEKSGYASASKHLFQNAYYILTPLPNTDRADIEFLKSLISRIGAIPIEMDAELHDSTVAAVSHLPHVISATLVNLVKKNSQNNIYINKLAAGGFKDITRISSSNPEIWKDICDANYNEIKNLLHQFIQMLHNFSFLLDKKDLKGIYDYFKQAKIFRDGWADKTKDVIYRTYDVILDIEDKPGIIGEITTILGNNNINIKNLSILNSREQERGCLNISFEDYQTRESAFNILKIQGYSCYKK